MNENNSRTLNTDMAGDHHSIIINLVETSDP
jgi:hypothetical protein